MKVFLRKANRVDLSKAGSVAPSTEDLDVRWKANWVVLLTANLAALLKASRVALLKADWAALLTADWAALLKADWADPLTADWADLSMASLVATKESTDEWSDDSAWMAVLTDDSWKVCD